MFWIINSFPTDSEIKKETDIILDTEDILIVAPKTVRSSCKYGTNTKWCTAATRGDNFYNTYTGDKKGLIYFILKKERLSQFGTKKIALFWQKKSLYRKYTWFNDMDTEIDGISEIRRYLTENYGISDEKNNKYKEITNSIKNYLRSENSFKISKDLWVKLSYLTPIGSMVDIYRHIKGEQN